MEENKTDYDAIEEYSKLQFSIEEVSIIMKSDNLFDDDDATKAYKRGSLIAIAEVRKSIYNTAKQGSTPAQKQYMELVQNKDNREILPVLDGLKSYTCKNCIKIIDKLMINLQK